GRICVRLPTSAAAVLPESRWLWSCRRRWVPAVQNTLPPRCAGSDHTRPRLCHRTSCAGWYTRSARPFWNFSASTWCFGATRRGVSDWLELDAGHLWFGDATLWGLRCLRVTSARP